MFLLNKKTSWSLLILLFIFDNVVSYFAVTRFGGHELNLLLAGIVEKYPYVYFLCIPAEILIMFIIIWIIKMLLMKIFKKWIQREEILERITIQALVIYWAIGNSALNLLFLVGLRLPPMTWLATSLIGILVSTIYFLREDF